MTNSENQSWSERACERKDGALIFHRCLNMPTLRMIAFGCGIVLSDDLYHELFVVFPCCNISCFGACMMGAITVDLLLCKLLDGSTFDRFACFFSRVD